MMSRDLTGHDCGRFAGYALTFTACSTSVLPSDHTAPGTRWLAAITLSKAVSIHVQSG